MRIPIPSSEHDNNMSLSLSLRLIVLFLFVFILPSSQRNSLSLKQVDDERGSASPIEFPIVTRDAGEFSSRDFLVPVSIGDPPQTLLLIPDTGSDVTWFLCDRRLPFLGPFDDEDRRVFDSTRSATFTPTYCWSPACAGSPCSGARELCSYNHNYVDSTSTSGYWATDTVTVMAEDGSSVRVYDVMIGCSSRESTTNLDEGDGILGLAPNHPSFASQMAAKFGSVFSYFLWNDAGEATHGNLLVFGRTNRAGFDRGKLQQVELVNADPSLFFYVEVARILVDGVALDVPESAWEFDGETRSGGVILDTGTTFTFVPGEAFEAIHASYAEWLGLNGTATMAETDICVGDRRRLRVPELVVEFRGGARLEAGPENLLYEEGEGVWCMAIRRANHGDASIIGSRMQRGYFWEYDLHTQTVDFAPLSA